MFREFYTSTIANNGSDVAVALMSICLLEKHMHNISLQYLELAQLTSGEIYR